MNITLFVLFFSLFCVCYWLRYRKWINPYRLYMVFGKKGSGKSSYLVKQALFYQKKGFVVYTNMSDMMVNGVRFIDANDIGDFVPVQNSVLLLDEVGMLFDNRNFRNFKNSTRDFFKLQRHYKVIVFLASQSYDIDKKLRDLTDEMFLVKNVGIVYSLVRPIRKSITLTESTSEAESRIAENLKFRWFFSWRIFKIPRYAKYFESFQTPELPEIPFTEICESAVTSKRS